MKKFIAMTVLVILGGICVLIYWNRHLYYKADKTDDMKKKIHVLKQASNLFPWNPDIFYQLGNLHLTTGVHFAGEKNMSKSHFEQAAEYYEESLRLNPVSSFTHFSLGRTFYNLSFITYESMDRSFAQYRKAARLSGHHTPIFFDTGKILLTRWNDLDEENREFTVKVLKRIMENAEAAKCRELIQVWDLNVRDYEVMQKILPEKADIYRMYARFLGERSLSVRERHRYLTEAESIDFNQACELHEQAENDYFAYYMRSAFEKFQMVLAMLKEIEFYQNLSGLLLIDRQEYEKTYKSTLLYLVKTGLESGLKFHEIKDYLQDYLKMEEQAGAVREIDEFLQGHRIIGNELTGDLSEMEQFAFHIYLAFRENRYRDIMRIGRSFRESFVMVPKKNQQEYVRILQLVGDANLKTDYIYDAVEFYKAALNADPDNLDTMVRLRQSLIRLNKDSEAREIGKKINEIITAQKINWRDKELPRAGGYTQDLILDGQKMKLNFVFERQENEELPLVGIFFDGEVAWENYLDGNDNGEKAIISLPLDSQIGKNRLRIRVLNRRIRLLELNWEKIT